MKYCIEFTKNFSYIDEVDEIFIEYKRNESALENFIEKFKDKRILIKLKYEDLTEFIDTDIMLILFKAIVEKTNAEIVFVLPIFEINDSLKAFNILKEHGFNVCFANLVNSWDELIGLADMGVSDIYIVEELGFELDRVAAVLHERGIKVRCYPNIAQSSHPNIKDIKKFFVRPEDVETYEPYVDVFEFFGENHNLYYKVYAKDKKWFGQLNEIIDDYNGSLDSRCVVKEFAETRTHCGKKCLKGIPCRVCDKMVKLSDTMQENDLYFKSTNVSILDNE